MTGGSGLLGQSAGDISLKDEQFMPSIGDDFTRLFAALCWTRLQCPLLKCPNQVPYACAPPTRRPRTARSLRAFAAFLARD